LSFETDPIPIRVCPSCGSEFQPHVTQCLDCGTPTVAGWEGMTEGLVRDADPEDEAHASSAPWGSTSADSEEPEPRGVGRSGRKPQAWTWSARDEGDPRGLEGERIPIRACPACGSEFQPHVLECLDCGEATVPAWEGLGEHAPGVASEDEPDARDEGPARGVALRSGDGSYIKPLLERLARAGIAARVVPRSGRATELVVVVRNHRHAYTLSRSMVIRPAPV